MCNDQVLRVSDRIDLMEPSAVFAAVSLTHPFPQLSAFSLQVLRTGL